ncbi:MAG: ABC transporter permease, partial [Anaerolineae bacterium]|nr:ABC transporter permease [Anaerolineae bacterium]
MTHWFEVFRFEIRQQVRRKAYLFMTFGVPLIMIVAFLGYQFYDDQIAGNAEDELETPMNEINEGNGVFTGYVDQTPEGLIPDPDTYPEVACNPNQTEQIALAQTIRLNNVIGNAVKRISSPYCSTLMIQEYDTFEAGRAALEDGEIDNFVVIEADYIDTGNVSIYVDAINLEAMDSEAAFSDFLLRSLLYNVDAADYAPLYLRLRDPAVMQTHRLTATGETEAENIDQNIVLIYAFGLLSMLGIFWGGGYLMQSVVQEKESRIIEIVMSSVQPMALLFGKVLAMGLLSLLQIATVGATMMVLGQQVGDIFASMKGVEFSTTLIVLLPVYFVLGFLLFG